MTFKPGGKRGERRSIAYSRGLQRRSRKPGEIATRCLSIRNFCYECMGYDPGDSGSLSAAVKECTAVSCWLWPWRNGKVDTDEEF